MFTQWWFRYSTTRIGTGGGGVQTESPDATRVSTATILDLGGARSLALGFGPRIRLLKKLPVLTEVEGKSYDVGGRFTQVQHDTRALAGCEH